MTRFILSNAYGEQAVYAWTVNDIARVYINGVLTINDPYLFCTTFRSDVTSCSGTWPGCGICPNPILDISYPFTIRIEAINWYDPGYSISQMILRDLDNKIDYYLYPGVLFEQSAGRITFLDQTWAITSTPANITATNLVVTPGQTPCIEPCNITVDVTWQNTGGLAAIFVPAIKIDTIRTTLSSVTLYPGLSITRRFTIIGLTAGLHEVCPDPN